MRALAGSLFIAENALAKPLGSFTTNDLSSNPSDCAAVSVSFNSGTDTGLSGLKRTAIRVSPGTISFSSSSRLALTSGARTVSPVIFPPGGARLATSPVATRSPHAKQTIGNSLQFTGDNLRYCIAIGLPSSAAFIENTGFMLRRRCDRSYRVGQQPRISIFFSLKVGALHHRPHTNFTQDRTAAASEPRRCQGHQRYQ